MAQLYDRSLMLSIAIYNAPFSLIVPFSHPEPSIRALKRLVQAKLTQKVTQLAQGRPDLITIPWLIHASIQD